MRNIMRLGSVMVLALMLAAATGCSTEQVKRATYNALQNKNCIDKTGYSNCDSNRPDYDQYQRERNEVLEKDERSGAGASPDGNSN